MTYGEVNITPYIEIATSDVATLISDKFNTASEIIIFTSENKITDSEEVIQTSEIINTTSETVNITSSVAITTDIINDFLQNNHTTYIY